MKMDYKLQKIFDLLDNNINIVSIIIYMNKPNLVDIKLIENLISKSPNIINSSPITRIDSIGSIGDIFRKYWLAILVLICVIIFILYNTKKEKKKIKQSFTNQKINKRKKIEKYINSDIPPMQYPQSSPQIQHEHNGKKRCLTCKDNVDIDYKQQIPIEEFDDQPLHEPEYNEHMNQNIIEYQQPMQKDTNYENQYYGQSITEEINSENLGNINTIESFNSGTYGNYVAF